MALADIRFDGVHDRHVDVDAVGDKGADTRVDKGIEVIVAEGAADQFEERAPVRTRDSRGIEHSNYPRIVGAKERFVGRPAQSQAVIEVPWHMLKKTVGRFK